MAQRDVLREFLVALGFEVNEGEYKKFNDVVAKVTGQVAEIATTAVAAGVAISAMIERAARQFEDLYYFARRAGSTVESFQALRYAAQQAGLGIDDLTTQARSLFEMMMTNPGTEGLLHYLGVQTREMKNGVPVLRDTKDILLDLSDVFRNMPIYQAIATGKALGMTADMVIKLRDQGPQIRAAADALAAMQREAGLSADEIERLAKQNTEAAQAFDTMKARADLFGTLLERKLLPLWRDLIGVGDKVLRWLDDLDQKTDGVSTMIVGLGTALGGAALGVKALSGVLGLLGIDLGGSLLAPIAPYVLALAAIGLVVYEIWDNWGWFKEKFTGLMGWFTDLAKSVGDTIDQIFYHPIDTFNRLMDAAEKRFDAFQKRQDDARKRATSDAEGGWRKSLDPFVQLWNWANRGEAAPTPEMQKHKEALDELQKKNQMNLSPLWNGIKNLFGVSDAGAAELYKGGTRPGGPPGRQANAAIIDKAMGFFMKAGWTAEQAAGIVGNLLDESALNPGAVNRSSGAYGVAQWLGSRYNDLLAFARERGLDPGALETQLMFVQWELTHSEAATGAALGRARSAPEASDIFGLGYERYGNVPGRLGHSEGVASGLLQRMGNASLGSGNIGSVTINANQKTDINVKGSEPHATAKAVAKEQERVSGDWTRNLGAMFT